MHRIIAFVLAEGPAKGSGTVVISKPAKSSPPSFGDAVPRQYAIGQDGDVHLKSYPPNILIAERSQTVEDIFSREAFTLRDRMLEECKQTLQKHRANLGMYEEYAIAVVDGYTEPPEHFLRNARAIAGFVKSEEIALDEEEVTHTLKSQLKYGEDDLVIVDWDGAFVFEPNGDVASTVELLQVANLQLILYRILDRDLDARLRRVEAMVRAGKTFKPLFWNRELTLAFRKVIQARARSIVEFDAVSREMKLIGDWYSARLYELAAKKFRLEDWRRSIKDKLSSLEDVYAIIAQNFSISKQYVVEAALQFGWAALIAIELLRLFHQ